MRRCKYCNAAVDDDAFLCPVCGKAIPGDVESIEPVLEREVKMEPKTSVMQEVEVLPLSPVSQLETVEQIPVNEPIKTQGKSKNGYYIAAGVVLLFFLLPFLGGNTHTSTGSSSASHTNTAKSTDLRPGEYWCMGKNDTCKNKTYSAYDLYCDSCDPDGNNIEGLQTSSSTGNKSSSSSSGKSSGSSGSKSSSNELAPGEYWCMGKNDTCKNKTYSPYDLYCSSCDPDGDNIEG